jgi:DnaJ-class molecular chaperone
MTLQQMADGSVCAACGGSGFDRDDPSSTKEQPAQCQACEGTGIGEGNLERLYGMRKVLALLAQEIINLQPRG